MYDWIIIVMSNKRVPPDPSRYLDVSYFLVSKYSDEGVRRKLVYRMQERQVGPEKRRRRRGGGERGHTVKLPTGNVQHH